MGVRVGGDGGEGDKGVGGLSVSCGAPSPLNNARREEKGHVEIAHYTAPSHHSCQHDCRVHSMQH